MAKAKKNEVEETQAIEKTPENTAVEIYDYGDDYGDGYDPSAAEDMLIPRLVVLQTNSPQCLPVKDGGIEGAEPGMLWNTVTNELMEKCRFVPATSEKCYNEWIKRDDGGGFVGRHELGDPFVIAKRRETPRGKIEFTGDDGKMHQLTETVYLYMVPVDENNIPLGGFCVLDFTSTKLKAWRAWNTKIRTLFIPTPTGKRQPPFYAHCAVVSTRGEKNDQGRWYNLMIDPAGADMRSSLLPPSSPAFQAAKDLADLVKKGLAKPQTEQDEVTDRGDVEDKDPKGAF